MQVYIRRFAQREASTFVGNYDTIHFINGLAPLHIGTTFERDSIAITLSQRAKFRQENGGNGTLYLIRER